MRQHGLPDAKGLHGLMFAKPVTPALARAMGLGSLVASF